MDVIVILALAFTLSATFLAFVFLVPEKKRAALNKFWQFIHDTPNFRYLVLEKILQALYIFATIYTILYGFFLLFYVQSTYYSSYWYGGQGLLIMLLGPVAVQVAYEMLMMLVLLVKNVGQINQKLKGEVKEECFTPAFLRKKPAPQAPAQQENTQYAPPSDF